MISGDLGCFRSFLCSFLCIALCACGTSKPAEGWGALGSSDRNVEQVIQRNEPTPAGASRNRAVAKNEPAKEAVTELGAAAAVRPKVSSSGSLREGSQALEMAEKITAEHLEAVLNRLQEEIEE